MNGNKINAVFYAESYHPIQAGSIDGTDILPHDNAIYRAHLCASAGLYDPFGDPKVIGDPYCTVFVGRLSRHTSEDTLHEAMSEYGRVKNLRLVRHIVTGASRGYAFVEYETEREMRSAYKDAHHTMIDDCKIIVDYYRQQLMPGWIPRRLGGGLGGEKESGQLRFGGREKPFRAPLKPIPFDDLKRLGIPPPPEGRYMSRFQDPSPPRRERNSVDTEGSQKRDVQDRTHKRSFVDGEDRYHKRSSLDQEDHSHKWSSVERDERYSERTSMDRYHKRSSLDQDEHSHKWSSVEREEHYSERTSVDRDDRSHNMSSSRREERHHKRSSSSRSHKRSSKDRDERTHKSHKHSDNSPRHERRSTSCDLSSDLSKDSNEARLGVVIQYDKGEVMAALAEKILLPTSVELLESLAARRAVLFTVELGFNQAIFEGNSKMVVKALNKEDLDRSSIRHVIKDIKSMSSLLQIHSSHTKR